MSRLVGFSRNRFPNSKSENFGNFQTMKEERRNRLAMGRNRKPLYLVLAEVVPGFEATDSRDLIYAFLGLQTSSIAQAICPDYTLDYQTVLIESTIAIMKASASLAIFSVIENESRDSLEQIPTWVVDWKACSLLRATIDFHDADLGPRHFYAAGRRQYSPVYDSISRFLKVPGRGIDSVTYVLGSDLGSITGVWQKKIFYDDLGEMHPAASLEVDENVAKMNVDQTQLVVTCERFMRVVLADCSHRYELSNDFISRDDIEWTDYRRFYCEWKATLSNCNDYRKELRDNPYLYAMEVCAWVAYERRVFVTAQGRLGLGPRTVQAGDQISLLHGSTTPIVLRQSNQPGGTLIYTVVGDCYLENVMFGEAMTWKEDECNWFTLG